jgi:hypothetical protein
MTVKIVTGRSANCLLKAFVITNSLARQAEKKKEGDGTETVGMKLLFNALPIQIRIYPIARRVKPCKCVRVWCLRFVTGQAKQQESTGPHAGPATVC